MNIKRSGEMLEEISREITRASQERLELLYYAFMKETGLKPSETELVSFYDPLDSSFHFSFKKKENTT